MRLVSIFATAPEEVLYGYGPLGVGVVALAFFGHKMFGIILKDRDKAIADRDAMVQDLFTKVLPAITRNTDVLEGRQDIDRELVAMIKESNKQLEANTKTYEELQYLLRHGSKNDRVGGV
jgi:hypothetical protein